MVSVSVTDVRPWGVGMPAWMQLHQFGDVLIDAFGAPAYLVGSALKTKDPRDVDVRLPLDIDEFIRVVGPADTFGRAGTRWAALALAFSALGNQMTGKLIDFQVQHSGISLIYSTDPKLLLGTKGGDR